MTLHTNKKGLRVMGVAESFRQGDKRSTLAAVVMRGDLVVDGLALGRTVVGGDDATSSILSLFRRLGRNDVNLIMVSGTILSLYNIVDSDKLSAKSKLPVICLTYKQTSGIEDSIRRHFPDEFQTKVEAYKKLGERVRIKVESGSIVYARLAGVPTPDAKRVLDLFTLQGAWPEPIRVAKLLARAAVRRP